jgi:hypothetical protein
MFNTKTLVAAASLAVLTAAGLGTASADPWDHRFDRRDWRAYEHHERMEQRAFVNRWRVAETLRFHRFEMVSDPFFFHSRYVVRVHDRFGHPVLVQVDPYSGAFIRVL